MSRTQPHPLTLTSVHSLSKLFVSLAPDTSGLNFDSISRRSSFAQLMLLKKGCFLMASDPLGPEPSRLAGSLARRPLRRVRASQERNLGNLALAPMICCCSWLRDLARKGGTPHSISYSRIL